MSILCRYQTGHLCHPNFNGIEIASHSFLAGSLAGVVYMDQNTRKNLFLSLTSGLLLGIPWSVSPLFFLIFIAWVPLLLLEEEIRDHPNSYILFNYAFVSFLLWNILGTWWILQAQWLGAILIMLANALLQALVFWSISRDRKSTRLNSSHTDISRMPSSA